MNFVGRAGCLPVNIVVGGSGTSQKSWVLKFVQAGGRFVVRILTKKFMSFSVTLGMQLNVKMYADEQKKNRMFNPPKGSYIWLCFSMSRIHSVLGKIWAEIL